MKTTIYCLLIAICLRVAWTQGVYTMYDPVPTPPKQTGFITDGEKVLLLKGKVAGEFKNWLIVETHNGREWRNNGYDPTFTRILADYKPLFRKLPNGQWEIMFTSEIAENLP